MTVFPNRPAENQDPWYNTREAYDNAVENAINGRLQLTKGSISTPTNIELLNEYSDNGSYAVRQSNFVDTPLPGNSSDVLWIVENYKISLNARIVRATSSLGVFQKRLLNNVDFGPYVRLDNQSVATDEIYGRYNEGSIIHLVNENAFYYDFTEFATGIERYLSMGATWILNDSDMLDGRGVRVSSGGDSFLVLSDFDSFGNGIVKARMQRDVVGSLASAVACRVHQDAKGNRCGIVFGQTQTGGVPRIALGTVTADGTRTIASSETHIQQGQAFYIKASLSGALIQVKAWGVNEPEPDEWDITTLVELYSDVSGRVGFRSSAASTAFDMLYVEKR